MVLLIPTLAAILPFVLLLVLIVVKKWSSLKVMPLVWFVTALISLLIWKLNIKLISASFIKGTFLTLEIMLIIFGAVWLLTILQEKKRMHYIQEFLSSISPDARIQAIIIAWLFGSLIEGVAGFGTPAAIVAPLLVSLGFTPLLSVVLALISNSTAVSFGAAGTPILLGLGSLNIEKDILQEVTRNTALLHAIGSIIIPIALVYLVISHSKTKIKKPLISILPFAFLSWLSFIVPYFLVAWFIGPELPSILGSITAIIITSTAAHFKFLTPKNTIEFAKHKRKTSPKQTLLSILPYILIILLLLLSRLTALKTTLTNITLSWTNILSTNISYQFLPLYTPSFFFMLTALFSLVLFKTNKKEIKHTLKRTFSRVSKPTISLIFALALVQLFLISSNSSLPSMPLLLAQLSTQIFQQAYLFITPYIGLLGSFIAGSNTLSNLLFGTFQLESAKSLGLPITIILALQVVGGAIGNMIAIHNVLAANATVNLENALGKVIRKTIIVSLLYALIVGITAFVIINI